MSALPDDAFQTTNWSLILAAGAGDGTSSTRALASLCELYWQPLYAFVRRNGHSPDEARDLTQAYFLQLLEKESLRGLVPEAGRFRSFLLSSMKNFVLDEHRKEHALKRRGEHATIALDTTGAERQYGLQPTDGITPELLYEKRWAATVLRHALDRLQERAEARGEGWEFEQLKVYLRGGRPAPSYKELAARLELNEAAARKAVHRLRKRFGTMLRLTVAATVSNDIEIDDEIRHLLSVIRTQAR